MKFKIKDLPDRLLHIPEFISLVGSSVQGEGDDVDILVRGLQDMDEDVVPLIQKALPDEKLHFTFNPTGPHGDSVPLYDLYLVRRDEARVKRAAEALAIESALQGLADWAREQMADGSLKIDLGCGENKPEGYFGIDKTYHPGVDLVLNFAWECLPFPDGVAAEVRAHHVLEHLNNFEAIALINETWRILAPGGKLDIEVPSTEGPGAFMPDHQSYWNELSFSFFTEDELRSQIKTPAKFKVVKVSKKKDPDFDTMDVNVILEAVK